MSKPKTTSAEPVAKTEMQGETALPTSTTQTSGGAQASATPNPAKAQPPVPPDTTGAGSAATAPVDHQPEAKATKPKPTARVMIVKGPAKGRWRAGRRFGPEAVEIPAEELSETQIEQLEGDPELVCAWRG